MILFRLTLLSAVLGLGPAWADDIGDEGEDESGDESGDDGGHERGAHDRETSAYGARNKVPLGDRTAEKISEKIAIMVQNKIANR